MLMSLLDQNPQQSDPSTVDINIHKPIHTKNSLYVTAFFNFWFIVGIIMFSMNCLGNRCSNSCRLMSSRCVDRVDKFCLGICNALLLAQTNTHMSPFIGKDRQCCSCSWYILRCRFIVIIDVDNTQ